VSASQHCDENGRVLRTRCDLVYSTVLEVCSGQDSTVLQQRCRDVFSSNTPQVDYRFLARRVDDPLIDADVWMLVVVFASLVPEDKVQSMFWNIVGESGQFVLFDRFCRRCGADDGCAAHRDKLRAYIDSLLSRAFAKVRFCHSVGAYTFNPREECTFGDSVTDVYDFVQHHFRL